MSDSPFENDRIDWEPYDRHWIRLRGPWEIVRFEKNPAIGFPTDSSSMPALPRRCQLPADWRTLVGESSGTAHFRRRFQCPTNLDADERVLITLSEVHGEVAARLNDVPVESTIAPIGDPESAPCTDAVSFDVTQLLQSTNVLDLEVTVALHPGAEGACGLWRPVLLEVVTTS